MKTQVKELGSDHWEVIQTKLDFADNLTLIGRVIEARDLYEEVLKDSDKIVGRH